MASSLESNRGVAPGLEASELVGNWIQQSMKEIPHPSRLILIDTKEVNLGSVADITFDDLSGRPGEGTTEVDPSKAMLVITTGNAGVVVPGKNPNITGYNCFPRLDSGTARQVSPIAFVRNALYSRKTGMSGGGFRQAIRLYGNFGGYVQVLVELANHVNSERAGERIIAEMSNVNGCPPLSNAVDVRTRDEVRAPL